MEWKHTDSPIKERFQEQWSVKKVILTVFWKMKIVITIDFFEKDATVNSASDCHLFRQNAYYLLNDPRTYRAMIPDIKRSNSYLGFQRIFKSRTLNVMVLSSAEKMVIFL